MAPTWPSVATLITIIIVAAPESSPASAAEGKSSSHVAAAFGQYPGAGNGALVEATIGKYDRNRDSKSQAAQQQATILDVNRFEGLTSTKIPLIKWRQ